MKSIEEIIKDEAREKYPLREDKVYRKIDGWLQEAYIAGRSQNLEREKELEEVLENNNAVLKSILGDLPKEGLGLIFVKQQIASNEKYLKPLNHER